MIRDYIERNQSNAVIAAVITAVLALVGSLGQVYLTYYYNTQSQDRQIKIEQISKFDGSSAELISAAGTFINAVNDKKDLEDARKQLSAVLATQIFTTQNLQNFYGNDIGKLIRDYQTAISELNQISQKTGSVTEMRPWTESFGRVLDTRANLSNQLHTTLGSRRAS